MPSASPYSVHPSVAYLEAIVDNLEASTGRPMEGWLRALRSRGPKDVQARTAWLKAQGLGSNQAALVTERSAGRRSSAFDQTAKDYLRSVPRYLERQYGGKKAGLRPLYHRILALGLATGTEAKACPCETIVPLYRNHVFAQIKPTTLTRIDLGLALGDPAQVKDPSGRLIDTGGFGKKDRITHRIAITRADEIDATVKRWLQAAYRRDA